MVSSATHTLLHPAGTQGQSIVFDVRRRPSNASQLNTAAEDVGNLLCSIPSPPNTPEESLSPLSSINSGNFNPSPNFLESKKHDDNLSIEFSNGDQWCGFLPSSETLAIEKVEWDSVQFLREDIVALLELGETLNVNNLVVVMPKFIQGLTELIHSFMYVGGALVDLKTTGWGIKDDYIAFSMQI